MIEKLWPLAKTKLVNRKKSNAVVPSKDLAYWGFSASFLILVLVARGWGLFQRVEIEETFNAGAVMSSNWQGVFTAQMYQSLLPKMLTKLALLFPLGHLPMALFFISLGFWMVCLLSIQITLVMSVKSRAGPLIAAVFIALTPVPLNAWQGLVVGSLWIQLVLLICVAATPIHLFTKAWKFGILCFGFITSMSHPVAGIIGVYLLVTCFFGEKRQRQARFQLGASILFGFMIQLYAYSNRVSQLSYLGEFKANTLNEVEALDLLKSAGALNVRSKASGLNFQLIVDSLGGLKFMSASVFPDPWKSQLLMSRSMIADAIIMTPLLLVLFTPLIVVNVLGIRKNSNQISKLVNQLMLLALIVSAFQFFVLGSLTKFQHVIPFVNIVWIVIAISLAFTLNKKALSAFFAVFLIALLLSPAIAQNFRDERLLGQKDAWSRGLLRAVEECRTVSPNEVVVIIQEDGPVGDKSAPFFLRCSVLLGNL